MKKPSRKSLANKCIAIWQELVKKNAGYKCEVCGKTGLLNSHHIIGKKCLTLRYDVKNGVCLCFTHHTGGNQSAHNDPQWFLNEWMVTNRPDDYNYLWDKKMELATNFDYEKTLDKLKKCLQQNKN